MTGKESILIDAFEYNRYWTIDPKIPELEFDPKPEHDGKSEQASMS